MTLANRAVKLAATKKDFASIAEELGGGGADVPELGAMLRTLARHCSSTALALAMHTHQVAIPAWRSKQLAAQASTALQGWSGASAMSRAQDSIPCNSVSRQNMRAPWRWDCQ